MSADLSTGQRQRVALAAALLHEPELLFLDEPTGGVDPKGRRLFWDLIYELAAERGMTVLVTTHYMDEAEQCDRLAFILNGRLIADGTPHELKEGLRGRIFEVAPAAGGDPFEALAGWRARPRSTTPTSSAAGCASWRGRAEREARAARAVRPARLGRAVARGRFRVARPPAAGADGESGRMKRLFALTWKEFLQLKRDPITLRMIVFMPMLQTLIFGYAINYDVKHLKMVVLDEARSVESRELVAKMIATEYFRRGRPRGSLPELRSARRGAGVGRPRHRPQLRQGLPPRRAGARAADRQRLRHDDGDPGHVHRRGDRQRPLDPDAGAARRLERRDMPIDLRVRPWYNPDLKTASFIIPGLIAIILTFTLIQFTASAIVRERERGTLEQLQVTPATRTEIILGKILPFTLIGYVQLTMTILLMRYLFQIPIQGSILELYVVGLLFIAAVLGLGMLISTLATTQMQAMQMSTFFLLPFVFLSGYVFPIDGMPMIFQYISRIIPARYFIEVLRGIILRGAGLADLWRPVAWLIFYTILIIGLAVARFKKTAA